MKKGMDIYGYTALDEDEGEEVLIQYIGDDNKSAKRIMVSPYLLFYGLFLYIMGWMALRLLIVGLFWLLMDLSYVFIKYYILDSECLLMNSI